MDIFADLEDRIAADVAAIVESGRLPPSLDREQVKVELSRDPSHGDLTTGVALSLIRQPSAHFVNARQLATEIAYRLAEDPRIAEAEVAGPGFINIRLRPEAYHAALRAMLGRGPAFGRGESRADPIEVWHGSPAVRVPMTMADARAAIVGDALANLLAFAGRSVVRAIGVVDATVLGHGMLSGDLRSLGIRPETLTATVRRDGDPLPGPTINRQISVRGLGGAHGKDNDPTVRDVVDEIGPDGLRVALLSCKRDAPAAVDVAAILDRYWGNPLFCIQYSHARGCSVLRQGAATFPEMDLCAAALECAPLHSLVDAGELDLLRWMLLFPRILAAAAAASEPQRIVLYLHDLASRFHAQNNAGNVHRHLRFINASDRELTKARLALVTAYTRLVKTALAILGVTAPEEMH